MLDFFRPGAKLELAAPPAASPGTTLPVSIKLLPARQLVVSAARLEIIGRETYFITTTSSTGRSNTTTTSAAHAIFSRFTVDLPVEGPLTPGDERRWQEAIVMPGDAAPSSRGRLVDVRWTVRASVSLPRRRDLARQSPLQVLGPAPASDEQAATAVSSEFDEAALRLELQQTALMPGAQASGRLRLEVRQSLDLRGIRAELVLVEDASDKGQQRVVAEQRLSGPVSLRPFESNPSYPLSLHLPADAPPTTRAPHSSLSWRVRIALDRRLRGDLAVEREVRVYQPPRQG